MTIHGWTIVSQRGVPVNARLYQNVKQAWLNTYEESPSAMADAIASGFRAVRAEFRIVPETPPENRSV